MRYMKLRKEIDGSSRFYTCNLTRLIDSMCPITQISAHMYNYLYDCRDTFSYTFAIRIPSRTTGAVVVDNCNVIQKCYIDDSCIGDDNYYATGVNEALRQFIGEVLEFE